MGKSIYDIFETDAQAENDGQWFDYGPGPSGEHQRFLLARTSRSNKKYTAAVQAMHDKYGKQLESKTLDDETAAELMLHIFCTTVLRSWGGIYGRDGAAVAWSVDAAKELLTALPDLHTDLEKYASDREHFRQVQNEADAGN